MTGSGMLTLNAVDGLSLASEEWERASKIGPADVKTTKELDAAPRPVTCASEN